MVIWLPIIFAVIGCSSNDTSPTNGDDEPGPQPNPIVGEVSVVLTTSDETSLLNELPEKLPFDNGEGDVTITIDENQTLQTIEGFGAALTGSSAFLLHNNTEALNTLFGDAGIKLSYTRLTIGASDFNKNGSYTYNDISDLEDLDLAQFSIETDMQDNNPVIPTAKAILAINSDMGFMASPWSAPAWMKSNRSLKGGSLDPKYYGVYSDYLLKYLMAYKQEGIPIHTITVQNEPLFETSAYPTMKMNASEQVVFIGGHFGPNLEASDLTTSIVGYDHNFRVDEDPDFPVTLLEDPEASKYTNAIGYHAYGGTPNDISKVTTRFPDAGIYFTEQSGIQNAGTTFGGEIDFFMKNVFMGTLRRGAKAILLWNLALDENAGPQNGGCGVCRGVLTITSGGTILKNVEYYMLGHFSKYVDSGAQVIATNELPGILENVAFKNPDGSTVLVVYNSSNTEGSQNLQVKIGDKSFTYRLPKGALATFKWN